MSIRLVACLLIGGECFTQNNITVEKWDTIDTEEYSIQYPSTWEKKENYMNQKWMIISPLESEKDKYTERIMIYSKEMKGPTVKIGNLKSLVLLHEHQLKNMLDKFNLIESTSFKTDSTEFYKFDYIGKIKDTNTKFKIRWVQYISVFNDKGFIITFTCEEKAYDRFKNVAYKILDSFQFKK